MNLLLYKLQMGMAIKQQRQMLLEFKELCELTADQMKMYYDALINAGFTEEQAIDLLAFHGIDAGRISHLDKGSDSNE